MSINVTVSGNPISIKKGKMVTADPNHAKKEFNRRRLLRLEQVRQQSKDIAEDVRNKVRKEKKKQENEIEEQGRQKLKSWQNRKLLELQTQYKEALEELGVAHKEAAALEGEGEVVAERKEQNDKLAHHRGRVAANKLQIEKNKANFKKFIPIQQKKLVRDIENTRASIVSNIKKKKTAIVNSNKKKRKKALADINITIPESESETDETFESVGVEEISENRLSNVTEEQQAPSSSSYYTEDSDDPRTFLESKENDPAPDCLNPESMDQFEPVGPKPSLNTDRSAIEVPYSDILRERSRIVTPPPDTRISDRIKRREIMASQLDYCDIIAETIPTPFIKSNTQIRKVIESRRDSCYCGSRGPCSSSQTCMCENNQMKSSLLSATSQIRKPRTNTSMKSNAQEDVELRMNRKPSSNTSPKFNSQEDLGIETSQLYRRSHSMTSTKSNAQDEIPTKPPVQLKESSDPVGRDKQPTKTTLESTDSHKIRYYDHANRFSQDKLSNSHVQKITSDSIEVLPNVTSEKEWHEKMKQRDREAHMRGQRALEKERVHRDYDEMMKKLPLLQKKERICDITRDKPEFHMSEERLKEQERKKQNQLNNAYTKFFPNLKPALVTLPRNEQEKVSRMAFDDYGPTQSLNVAKWDVDCEEPKMFTIDEVQEIVRAFTGQKPKDRRAKLKELLSSLQMQKEQLLSEIRCLPRNESINELIKDLKSVGDSCKPRRRERTSKRKRHHEENEKETSFDSTTEGSSTSGLKPRRRRCGCSRGKCPGGCTKIPSPRKKVKIKAKRPVLVLQNNSTQTTPKTECPIRSPCKGKPEAVKKSREPQKKSMGQVCRKTHVICDCNKENINSTEELCQIFIKINDHKEPEVVVKGKDKEGEVSKEISKIERRADRVEKKIESKSVAVGTDEVTKETVEEESMPSKVTPPHQAESSRLDTKKIRRGERGKSKRDRPLTEAKNDSKAKSWKEHLSKNSLSSTSTSYYSPPIFQGPKDRSPSSHSESTKVSLYNLHGKLQQGNLSDVSGLSISPTLSPVAERTIDPILLAYIKKLLSMSRDNVDGLSVSTSNVETPSQSVVEMDSNNPLAQLHNLIRYFNLKTDDIARELSYSPDASTIHNSSGSPSEDSVQQRRRKQKTRSVNFQSPQGDASEKKSCTYASKSTQSIITRYATATDSCSQRIANLASMIQQIRDEKIQMLMNPPRAKSPEPRAISQPDVSTSSPNDSKHSSGNSTDDEEIHQRLMEIDLILANKLRKFTPLTDCPIIEEKDSKGDMPGPSIEDDDKVTTEHEELWRRLKRLSQTTDKQPNTVIKKDNQPFIAFLSDIPKLPKLVAQPGGKSDPVYFHKHPPPSKGLTIAKRFNGNISLVPHELSTIAEADSQISTKISSSVVSPNGSVISLGVSPHKDMEAESKPVRERSEVSLSSKSSKSSASKSQAIGARSKSEGPSTKTGDTDKSKSDTPSHYSLSMDMSAKSKTSSFSMSTSAVSKKSLVVSTSSSDELESIEAMLKSIGMDWAIPTLHKTHEALALVSSSSSQELDSKKKSKCDDSTCSEISLKDFLSKQILDKASSSSLNTDRNTGSLSLEFSDLSAIINSSEVKGKRTSTPITSSTSKSKNSFKPVVFSDASGDISSVNHSDKYSFHSISEHSQSKTSA